MGSEAGRTRVYALLFFLSGVTGLVYELVWVRMLYQTFGSTTQSVSTVVAAYMAGLGLGAWWLGGYADRHPKPAALYGWLEIAIGAFGIISPFVLGLALQAYITMARSWPAGGAGSVALRFGLAAAVLLIPTTLMGGTLPVLTRALTVPTVPLRVALGRLYGLNTLGAVVGAALAGFFLIEHMGIRVSLWGTAAVNFVLGGTAILLATPASAPGVDRAATALESSASEPAPRGLRHLGLALLALAAFSSLLAEIAWTRVLVMVVGGSVYAFTLVLLVFLLGIGIGSALVARAGGSPRSTAADAALAQGIAAAGCALVFFSLQQLPQYILLILEPPAWSAAGRLALMGGGVAIIVLIPAVGMGMTFPVLTELIAGRGGARGRDVGRAYALNTLGSIAGAGLTGFLLIALWGTQATLRVGVLVSGVASLALAVGAAAGAVENSPEHRTLRPRVLAAAFLTAIACTTALVAGGWDSRLIDLGPTIYGRGIRGAAGRRAFLEHVGARQLAFREGRNSTVSVWESESGLNLKVNGKVDASDRGDMDTQIMLAMAPLAARPNPRSALVIGYGSGVTVRVVAEVPGMERVRVVEIEPAVLAMSQYFTSVNHSVLSRPGVSVVTDDARSALQLDQARYDIIISEPSNPWLAGVATLYTPEFFRIARARLADDGIFCQWVQTYQLPLGVVASLVANVRAVFPHAEVWLGALGDLVVLGSAHSFRYDSAWVARLLGPGGVHRDLATEYLGVRAPSDYFGRLLLADSGSAELATRATVTHRDDHPALEFVAARRFLDMNGGGAVFDSLVAFGQTGRGRDRTSVLALATVVSRARWNPSGLAYVNAARRLDPGNPYWTVQTAGRLMITGEIAFADSALPVLAARGDPEALLLMGVLASHAHATDEARRFLARALAAGGDTAEASAELAALAVRESRWPEAALEARRALRTTRSTLAHPYPSRALSETFTQFSMDGPPHEAERLLADALVVRPTSARVRERYAIAALRAGDCVTARAQLLELVHFGVVRPDGPTLLARCERSGAL